MSNPQADDALDLSHRLQADSVGRALSLVGERWTMLILRETFFGVRRYGQFARNLGIPRPTLSLRLRKLVDAGLLERVPYSSDPDRYEYRLTQSGRDLFPAVVALMRWGDQHFAGSDGPPIVLRHDTCGKPTHPHVTCDVCGGEIDNRNVTPERGPGYSAATQTATMSATPGRETQASHEAQNTSA
jgi:DNA-binding HxlR family transcriptional regulator